MNFPQPNEWGVYCKGEATEYLYDDQRLTVTVHLLQIDRQCWIQAVSFNKKAEGGGGTMGMGTPLSKVSGHRLKMGESDPRSELEALERARSAIKGVVENGRLEAQGKPAWESTWNSVEAWAFNIGRQQDLFEAMS